MKTSSEITNLVPTKKEREEFAEYFLNLKVTEHSGVSITSEAILLLSDEFIQTWKINKFLYEKYGGTVIFHLEKLRWCYMKANDFDKKFDEGSEDITDELDLSSLKRPNQEQKRVNVDFPIDF